MNKGFCSFMQAGWQSKATFGIKNAPDFKTCAGGAAAV